MKEPVFALDIGTQSVTGILLQKNEQQYKIIDFVVKHHEERSMLDGQIHDVMAVASIIDEVKQDLEKTAQPLHDVAVAAAGRALKTIRTEKTVKIAEHPFTSMEDIAFLELSAVQKAQTLLAKQEKHDFSTYHCVGYSVLHYYIDDETIGSLMDQDGEEAKVEIIATFLPKLVVQSLLSALERANLSMQALTLEPIAAIHVLVPASMRRLNVALIDIGAGTSDIAIANEDTIVAYGMVPSAGDAITEAISDAYLLDFKVAEQVKKEVVNEKLATVEDILGFETTITYDALLPHIENSINRLARLLADEVMQLNRKTPQAIMLIGGGSLTPLLNEKLASYLQLPANRVAIRGSDAIKHVNVAGNIPTGPEFVTPIGIAVRASEEALTYTSVYVNDKTTWMFDTKDVTVSDCLIQAGIDLSKYYGSLGLSQIITYNGKPMTLRGMPGGFPRITINGKTATIDNRVHSNDRIILEKGREGTDARYTIKNIVEGGKKIHVLCNGQAQILETRFFVNDEQVNEDYVLKDKDQLVVDFPETIKLFLQNKADITIPETAVVYVNNRRVPIQQKDKTILLNGAYTTENHILSDGDSMTVTANQADMTVRSLLTQLDKKHAFEISVTFNGERIFLQQQTVTVKRDDTTLTLDDTLFANDQITVKEEGGGRFIFQDVFRFTDIHIPIEKGSYTLYKNDTLTTFHEEIQDGDELYIEWED